MIQPAQRTALFLVCLVIAEMLAGQTAKAEPIKIDTIASHAFTDCLAIPRCGVSRRSPVHTDEIEALWVDDSWKQPKLDDTVTLPDGTTHSWVEVKASEEGWFAHDALAGGYAHIQFEANKSGVMMLDASGHSMVYVNGTPRTGDPYATGWVKIPIMVKAEENNLLFRCGRGRLRASIVTPRSAVVLNTSEATLPDFLASDTEPAWASVLVANASTTRQSQLCLDATWPSGERTTTPLPALLPLSLRKVPFKIAPPKGTTAGQHDIQLTLRRLDTTNTKPIDQANIKCNIRKIGQSYKRTYVSTVDGSVQYYAVTPAASGRNEDRKALVLTLHGAGVEAISQANSYASKPWCHIVAPTNRRPFGFDWEDWGRLDAIDVLNIAEHQLNVDRDRIYLTGHSMGGHGTWHVGVTFPDRFAAIAPSAGWMSFWSYTGAADYENASALEKILLRATTPSRTERILKNLNQCGVYILHGEKDDNVPATEAQKMVELLGEFHKDFQYFEQPGAGHWWDNSDEPGAQCIDWPEMFDFFARHRRPQAGEIRSVRFSTANPEVSSQCHWATVHSQITQNDVSSIDLRCDPKKQRFEGTTDNVQRLIVNPASAGIALLPKKEKAAIKSDCEAESNTQQVVFKLDGGEVKVDLCEKNHREIVLSRVAGTWTADEDTAESRYMKGPHRYGPFKHVFRNRVIFVYGTAGNANENAWAIDKAKYDAETFWYRGNGSIEVVSDVEYLLKSADNRSVVLYGHAEMNGAWKSLLTKSDIYVGRNKARIGDRSFDGENLACLFIHPKPGSDSALVGVIAGTGLPGMKLTERIPYFVSGVAFPDVIIMGTDVLRQGTGGVKLAGFFGLDWSVEGGDLASE